MFKSNGCEFNLPIKRFNATAIEPSNVEVYIFQEIVLPIEVSIMASFGFLLTK